MATTIKGLRTWLAEALEFTIGATTDIKRQPPPIGPQPYSEKPEKVHF